MDGKEAIIAKIISDAEDRAREKTHAAEVYAVSTRENAEKWARTFSAEQEKLLDKDVNDMVARRKIVAELDVRKNILKAKQTILNEIFVSAEKKLCSADKKSYLKFVLKNIAESADDGDEVVLSCDGVLTEKDLTESAIFKARNLKIAKIRGNFVGGVMLIGKTCDKNLTFHEIVLSEKAEKASYLAKQLFG